MSIRLSNDALPAITDTSTPGYDRAHVTVGIVHFGVGGFHRAHQAMYVDRLLAEPEARSWGICGVGVRPADQAMRDALVPQDGLYTLTLKSPDGAVETSVIGSIVEYLYAPDDPETVLDRLADPETRIVSLTVTEGGYNFSPATGEFDVENPAIVADLSGTQSLTTVFGLVTEALARRRARGLPSFTVMSCDNIQGNGHIARSTFLAYAHLRDPELARWIDTRTSFPNSMVDRITPVTPPELAAEVEARTGIVDNWPVVAEPFTQWVLEDSFSNGRPALENVGVQIVDDVTPYELMKLRLLNASHQALCYFGYLLGYRYVHDAAIDSDIRELLRRYMLDEAEPALAPLPGVDVNAYIDTLLERFANPAIADTIARLCQDSSDRIPKWLVPVIRERLGAGGNVDLAAAVVASWTRYAEGIDENGDAIDVVDPKADELVPLAQKSRTEPLAFVSERGLFGELADHDGFTTPYLWALETLRTKGSRETLKDLLS
ncbi:MULTISPECIES: mannitol dehydrogenase family protein [unclassified Gordonia (in: high G+C Gram-positive bacteria)]|uniref:mannitol dehydrogenase family protein n=1 Tax=unclassified Gordonia (in: high G+C Gram-positive bacteria) TaxID=2657482 RepID=UPI0007EB4889|nr:MULTISPECIES: mannitol dehydrogenase family protein [unclassified Gordonia (in: high G+C Gram-positive bacteria)]OBC06549.1 mannitol dehydrogenase [Gordonia sp. 852002-50395_SCH5434458]OBC11688.1 mannitol dehydrogenase [Gordonia sp. 852002-50816_SCH5313054-a]OBC16731.1 mannitol dehydrogenase [Gordonia sp. 852002-50816_SCH5313054-c]